MLYNLIKKELGKEEVVMTQSLSVVNKRMQALRTSQKGKKITYRTEPADEDAEKYKKRPDTQWRHYDNPQHPKRV